MNKHYGMLTDRFDRRSRLLRAAGFVYHHIPEFSTAVFTRPAPNMPHRKESVSASAVMHADDLCWADYLSDFGLVPDND